METSQKILKIIKSTDLFEGLRDGNINPKEELKNQARFKSDLSEIKIGGNKSPNQNNTIKNVYNFFDLREKINDFFRDYSFLLSEGKYKGKQGTGLRIITRKQMFQRLPLLLSAISAGNISESLLNEIRQIVYSLYRSKEITKKVYNNIIKSIKL